MPIYEYACQSCGHQFDTLQKLSEAPLTDCPVCQKPALTKLMSAAGFRLKGGGWYETDFKSKDQRNLADKADSKSADRGAKAAEPKNGSSKKADAPAAKTKEIKKPASGSAS